jgi:predicted DNA-binding transcriptional regulator AlpA
MLPKLLTAIEVARLKGVSRTLVYNAMNKGKLPYIEILGRRAVKESEAKKWKPPGRITGRPKGIPVTDETKAKISEAQKKRWQLRQNEVRPKTGRTGFRKSSQ